MKNKNMNPKQYTAVEWLEKEIERLTTRAGIHISWEIMDGLLKEAKLREKWNFESCWIDGRNDGWNERENDYNPMPFKKSNWLEWYNYEFKYEYGKIKNS